jgi:hypothetical protein
LSKGLKGAGCGIAQSAWLTRSIDAFSQHI